MTRKDQEERGEEQKRNTEQLIRVQNTVRTMDTWSTPETHTGPAPNVIVPRLHVKTVTILIPVIMYLAFFLDLNSYTDTRTCSHVCQRSAVISTVHT